MATWIDVNSNYLRDSGVELSEDLRAVQNSVENILNTPIGSRPMEREYGSRLYYFVHEPMDAITEEDIRVSVIQALERWEPRIKIDVQKTNVQRLTGTNGYSIELHFSVIVPRVDNASMRFIVKKV